MQVNGQTTRATGEVVASFSHKKEKQPKAVDISSVDSAVRAATAPVVSGTEKARGEIIDGFEHNTTIRVGKGDLDQKAKEIYARMTEAEKNDPRIMAMAGRIKVTTSDGLTYTVPGLL